MIVTGFYEANEQAKANNDGKEASQIIVDALGEVHGVSFFLDHTHTVKTARNLPSALTQSTKYRYECQQKQRAFKPSQLEYTQTRNRRLKLTRYDCKGQISVYFPKADAGAPFDFAIDYEHALHPGHEHFGVPKVVRDWICDNPRPSPLIQREDLLSAIANGEIQIPGGQERYLSPSHISYWWRKGLAKTVYVSKDAWENVAHILHNHSGVHPSLILSELQASNVIFNTTPRKHIVWFVHETYPIDLSKVREIFIDATYNTSKTNTHLYSICAQELGYSTPLAFMLMEIHPREDTKTQAHSGEALECNRNFYTAAKDLGLYPTFVHTDKDWSEISAAQVFSPHSDGLHCS